MRLVFTHLQGLGVSQLAGHLVNEINQGPCYVKMSNPKFKSSMNFSKKLGFCFVGQFLLSQEILAVRTLHAVHSFITSLLAPKKVRALRGAFHDLS